MGAAGRPGPGPGPGRAGLDRAVPGLVPSPAGAAPAAPGPGGGLRLGGGVGRAVLGRVR